MIESIEDIKARNLADVKSGRVKRFVYLYDRKALDCWFGDPLNKDNRECMRQGTVVDNILGRTLCYQHALESGMNSTNSLEQNEYFSGLAKFYQD